MLTVSNSSCACRVNRSVARRPNHQASNAPTATPTGTAAHSRNAEPASVPGNASATTGNDVTANNSANPSINTARVAPGRPFWANGLAFRRGSGNGYGTYTDCNTTMPEPAPSSVGTNPNTHG